MKKEENKDGSSLFKNVKVFGAPKTGKTLMFGVSGTGKSFFSLRKELEKLKTEAIYVAEIKSDGTLQYHIAEDVL